MSFQSLALECVCSSFKTSQSQELCFLSASSHEYFLQRMAPADSTPCLTGEVVFWKDFFLNYYCYFNHALLPTLGTDTFH